MNNNEVKVNKTEEQKLTADELRQVSGGGAGAGNGVILVCTGKKYKCPEPDCNRSFDTVEELNRHSNEHYHAII